MTFLNTSLLFALAAVAIPIALHLLARKEPRQVVFPSLRLLKQNFETNRSKVRVRRWWLLALRMAAVATVAIALARPAIVGALSLTWTTIGIIAGLGIALLAMATVAASKSKPKHLVWSLLGAALIPLIAALLWGGYTLASGQRPKIDQSSPVALAIVFDNPPISGWTDVDQNRIDEMREVGTRLIQAVNPQSRLAVLDRSTTPAAFSLDLAGAMSKCNQITALEVVAPLESRLEAAARLLATSEITSRQLVLVSGLNQSSFSERPHSIEPLLTELGVVFTLWDLGALQGTNRSVAIATLSDLSPSPKTLVKVATTLSLDAAARSPNSEPVTATAECVLYPRSPSLPVVRDGVIVRPQANPVDRVSVTLSDQQSVQVNLSLPPLEPGLHHGAVRLVGTDALAIDDACYFTVSVLPPSRVLLIGDQIEEAAEIQRVITATTDENEESSQFDVQRIGYDDLPAARISDFDGVMMLNPPADVLNDPAVLRFMQTGGDVFVCAGPALGTGPVKVDPFPEFVRAWRATDPGAFLEISAPSHPILKTLATVPDGVPFPDFRIRQYWQVNAEGPWQSLMQYAGTGHAALLECTLPKQEGPSDETSTQSGRLVVLTTPIPELADQKRAWNELFLQDSPWPAFLLVRDVARYITRRSVDDWTSLTGSPVAITIERPGNTDDETQRHRLQWFPPVATTPIPIEVPPGDSQSSSVADRIRLPIGRPSHSGVHWVRGERPGLGFTVNARRDDLIVQRVDASFLATRFGEDSVRMISAIEDMDWTAGTGPSTVSLWSPIMLVALVVFLLEQVLSNRFYGNPASLASSGRSGR